MIDPSECVMAPHSLSAQRLSWATWTLSSSTWYLGGLQRQNSRKQLGR